MPKASQPSRLCQLPRPVPVLLTPTTTLSVIVPRTGNEQTARPASTGAGSAAAGAGQMPALTPSSGLSLPRTAPAGGGATTQNPLVLTMQEDSWIELKRADNTPVVSRVIRAGSVETFDVTEPLTLTVGNIAGVEARLRGAPIELASAATGNVARIRLK